MNSYIDEKKFSTREPVRQHPWSHSEDEPSEKYVDFKENPELIPEVLNSCKAWADYDCIQEWYGLIQWLNSPKSRLESNDSRLHGPHDNEQKIDWLKKLVCTGGLLFFFRNLQENLSPKSSDWFSSKNHRPAPSLPPSNNIDWLLDASHRYFAAANPEFKWGCISVSLFPTYYSQVQGGEFTKFGHEIAYEFWAWGDTEEETMSHCHIIIKTMFDSLKLLSDEVRSHGG